MGAKRRLMAAMLAASGARDVDRIPTWTSSAELMALCELASSCRQDAVALEIGSYLGASSCYIAAGLEGRSGRLFCVDTWQNETMPEGPRDTFEQFRSNIEPFAELITPVRKRSDALTIDDVPGPLDFVFIDGDHAYEAVAADFAAVSRRVADHAVVAFHDAANRDYPGVDRVIADAMSSGEWALEGVVESLAWLRHRGGQTVGAGV